MRGILKCQTVPKILSSIVKSYKLESNYIETEVQSLIDSGELRGKLKAGLYIPKIFMDMKEEIIRKSFENNGYLEYDWIEKNFLENKPKQLIEKMVKEKLVYLDSIVFSQKKM